MILKLKLFVAIVFIALIYTACTKESSFEGQPPNVASASGVAVFTLSSASGSCSGVSISGNYSAGIAANTADSVVVLVKVDSIGSYVVSTDTKNGMSFNGSGNFTKVGLQYVTLRASGRAIANGTFTYTAGINGCSFVVIVRDANSVDTTSSTSSFSLAGSPDACVASIVAGTYTAGTALGSANTLTFSVNVATAGTYTISTATVKGFSFSGSGTFSSTGPKTVVLTGSGTPIDSGTVAFAIAGANCSVNVKVAAASGPTSSNDCKSCTYYPTCVGTSYTTSTTLGAGGTTQSTSTIQTVTDTTISGAIYKKLTTQSGAVYINCDNGVVTLMTYNATSLGGSTASQIIQVLVKANDPVGSTWTNTLTATNGGVTIQDLYTCTIAEKGITKVVGGITFNNVIHVSEQISTVYMGMPIPSGGAEYYYASGIGFIESDFTDILGNPSGTVILSSYTIP